MLGRDRLGLPKSPLSRDPPFPAATESSLRRAASTVQRPQEKGDVLYEQEMSVLRRLTCVSSRASARTRSGGTRAPVFVRTRPSFCFSHLDHRMAISDWELRKVKSALSTVAKAWSDGCASPDVLSEWLTATRRLVEAKQSTLSTWDCDKVISELNAFAAALERRPHDFCTVSPVRLCLLWRAVPCLPRADIPREQSQVAYGTAFAEKWFSELNKLHQGAVRLALRQTSLQGEELTRALPRQQSAEHSLAHGAHSQNSYKLRRLRPW